MNRFILSLLLLLPDIALAQAWGGSQACIWQGPLANCLPSTGITLPNQRVVRFGELSSNGTDYVAVTAPASVTGARTWTLQDATDIFVGRDTTDTLTNKSMSGLTNTFTNLPATGLTGIVPMANGGTNKNMTASAGAVAFSDADSLELTAVGSSGQILHSAGTGTPTWSAVDLATAQVTGVLPLANGGSNKALTATSGGLVWSDADSLEITSASTAGNWVLSGGTGTPTMSSVTSTPKTVAGTTDAVQFTVRGNATQTTNPTIFLVDRSSAAPLMQVTDTNGTLTTGTTTGAARSAGQIGYNLGCSTIFSSPADIPDNTAFNVTSGSGCTDVPAGLYLLTACIYYNLDTTTTASTFNWAISNTSTTYPNTDTTAVPTSNQVSFYTVASIGANGEGNACTSYPVTLANSTTDFYLVATLNLSSGAGTDIATGYINFIRIQ